MLRAYLLFVGISLLACGAGLTLKTARQRARQGRTTGQIVGVAEQSDQDSESQTYFFARIAFVARDGTPVEFVSRVGSSRKPPIGNRLPVRYDPEDPNTAAEDTLAAQWGFPTALCCLGIVSLAVALMSPSV